MSTLLNRLRPLSVYTDGGRVISEVAKSGVIIFRSHSGEVEFLLIHRRKHNDWSFPKGHVESGEGLMEAAMREVGEETNVQPMILGQLTDLAYLNNENQSVRLAMFLGCMLDQDAILSHGQDGEDSAWVSLSKVEKILSYGNLRKYFRNFVLPLFEKKKLNTSPSIAIVFSEIEPYKNGSQLLVETLKTVGIRSRLKKLNNLKSGKNNHSQMAAIYFLTNCSSAQIASFWCGELEKRYVVNGKFLTLFHSKSVIQALLRRCYVPVPQLAPALFYKKRARRSTILVKSEEHNMRNQQAISGKSTDEPWRVYCERRIEKEEFTEHKISYIAGRLFTKDKRILTKAIKGAHHRIYEYLGLEVFSTDIFVSKKKRKSFFIIDVNPAPAFFHSVEARLAFGSYLMALSRIY